MNINKMKRSKYKAHQTKIVIYTDLNDFYHKIKKISNNFCFKNTYYAGIQL